MALREQINDPELRRRVLVVTVGYYVRRALDETVSPMGRRRAAGRAVVFAERLVTEDGLADQDDQLLLATAYEVAGRERDAARAYGEGVRGRDLGESPGLRRAALQAGLLLTDLDDPVTAAARLAAVVPALEREYLMAIGEEQVSDSGQFFTNAATTLALCQARIGEPEAAFSSLERSKSLRTRHRGALHGSASGRRFLELERILLAWERGANVRFTSSRPVHAGSGPDSVVLSASVAERLPADERLHQLRRELAQALPEAVPAPPAVGDWAGQLDTGEAVVSLGAGWTGTWWGAVTSASAREGKVAAHELRADWTSERWNDLVSEPEADSWLVALLTRRGPDLRTALVDLLAGADDFLRPMAEHLEALGLRRLRLVPQAWLRIVPFWAAPALSSFTVCVQTSAAVPPKRAAPNTLSEVLAVADPTGDLWAAAAEPEMIRTHLDRHSVTTRALVRTEASKSAVLAAARTADVVHVAGHGRTDLTDPGRSALWLYDPAAHRALRGGDDPFAGMAAQVDAWRETRPGLREVVISGTGVLSEYDAGDGVLERKLEHPLGSTRWIRYGSGIRTAELWTAEEITVGEALPRCRLAVLTACEAAGGGLSPIDEAAGLPAALTAAGVSTVVASFWPVDDDVAVLFTDAFYRGLADALDSVADVGVAALVDLVCDELRSMPRSEAVAALAALIDRTKDAPARERLRAARARRANGPDFPFADPIQWAAFGVFGDGLLVAGG